MRAVVHKTKGKLDLRSITVFGLNAKPNTDTPIGFFGTGLKYAIAVLSRYNIPVTFWIDSKQWVIEKDPGSFRNKEITELYICSTTIGGLIKKRIKLPFTTELGKTWELWQAYRELECNTMDENGQTFIARGDEVSLISGEKGYTLISVESEEYTQCHLDRGTYFLPGGLTKREGTDRLQVFARKSTYIYYRGVRIYKPKEPTMNTYNFLCPVELTEDRTAKYPYVLELEIENYIAGTTATKEVVQRAITAPVRTYERGLSYDYSTRSDQFLDIVEEAKEDATDFAKTTLRKDRPLEEPSVLGNWIETLIHAIEVDDFNLQKTIIIQERDSLLAVLRAEMDSVNKQIADIRDRNNLVISGAETGRLTSEKPTHEEIATDDDIPF